MACPPTRQLAGTANKQRRGFLQANIAFPFRKQAGSHRLPPSTRLKTPPANSLVEESEGSQLGFEFPVPQELWPSAHRVLLPCRPCIHPWTTQLSSPALNRTGNGKWTGGENWTSTQCQEEGRQPSSGLKENPYICKGQPRAMLSIR